MESGVFDASFPSLAAVVMGEVPVLALVEEGDVSEGAGLVDVDDGSESIGARWAT